MSSELVETWNINGRIVLYLLQNIENEWLSDVSASKGRTIGEQFAHLHNVRLMWLKSADSSLLVGLNKIEKGQSLTIEILTELLDNSAEAIAKMIQNSNGKIKGFKPHTTAFVGYLISHESHHRGQIMLSLKQSGRKISKSVSFGLWEWGTR